jgi:hypothetical protein
MKSLIFTAGLATLMLPLGAANAAVFSVGGPLSQNCYEAALAAAPGKFAIDACTRALNEEGLLGPDRAATYVNRGILQMSAGRISSADAEFRPGVGDHRKVVGRLPQQGILAHQGRQGAGSPTAASEGHRCWRTPAGAGLFRARRRL